MPIVIKAQGSDTTGDVIKKFKKAAASSNVVIIAKDRAFFQKPSRKRAVKKIERKRLQRRARSLKKMKNISPASLERLNERLGS